MLLEPMINSHKIKYSILKDLVREYIEFNDESDEVAIYINLDSILKVFYRDDIISGMQNLKYLENVVLCSEIANIAAHYRKFFWTRYQKKTIIYFYYMNKKPKYNISIYEDYAKTMIERKSKKNPKYGRVNEVIKDNLRMFSILSVYLPKVYFITTNGLEPALVPYHFIKEHPERTHLILTKDDYDFQLLGEEYTYILRLKYDDTRVLTRDNLFDYILRKNKYTPKNKIPATFYKIILPFIPCRSRDMKGVKGIGKVKILKEVDRLIEEKEIDPNLDINFKVFANLVRYDVDIDKIKEIYKICNLKYQYKRLDELDLLHINEQVIDKYENRTIMEINEKYFGVNPIMLIELMEGADFGY